MIVKTENVIKYCQLGKWYFCLFQLKDFIRGSAETESLSKASVKQPVGRVLVGFSYARSIDVGLS